MAPARYDEAADFYVAEVGDVLGDEGTAGLLELTGDVRGRRVLDLACGPGRITRELARRGAEVIGVDLSAALIERARDREAAEPLGLTYRVADAAALPVRDLGGGFDLVVCNFGLSDIDDLPGALDGVVRALRPGGAFVFSILHPCFPGWGPQRSSSWPPGRGYFHEGWWRADGGESRLRRAVGANHRTLSTYLNGLTSRGLAPERTLEPPPPRAWLTAEPAADPLPTFLVMRSRKV